MTTPITDLAAELDRRFAEAVESDSTIARIQRDLDRVENRIGEIWDNANLEVGRIRADESALKTERRTREKWLKSKIAHDLRHELGIKAIPGYESPLDKLRAQRKRSREAQKLASTKTTANDPAIPTPDVGQTVR